MTRNDRHDKSMAGMDFFDLFEVIGIEAEKKETPKTAPKTTQKKAAEPKKEQKAASKPNKPSVNQAKKEQKVKYPLTILTGICEPTVLAEAGEADTLEKVVKLVCQNKGWSENLCVAKLIRDDLVIVTLDRKKVKAKGEFEVAETTIFVVGNEEYSAAGKAGSKTKAELDVILRELTGMDETAEFSFIEDTANGRIYALPGVTQTFNVNLPVTIKSLVGEMVVTGKDLKASEAEDEEDEEGEEGGEQAEEKELEHAFSDVVIKHLEKSPMFGGFAGIMALYAAAKPKEKKPTGEKKPNVLYLDTASVTATQAPSTPKETMYPTDAILSTLFWRKQLTPEMFNGATEVNAKEIVRVLSMDYPEFTPDNASLTYYKESNSICPQLKSSTKGAQSFGSREECVAAAAGQDYFLANYTEDGVSYRYEKTFVSETSASADGTGTFSYKLPKVPEVIIEAVIRLFRYVSDNYGTEALVWIFYDLDRREYGVILPEQTVDKVSVYTEDMQLLSVRRVVRVADVHSHNTMNAFFSDVDNRDEGGNQIYGVMGRFDKAKPMMLFRAGTGGNTTEISLDSFSNWTDDITGFESVEAEMLANDLIAEFELKATVR